MTESLFQAEDVEVGCSFLIYGQGWPSPVTVYVLYPSGDSRLFIIPDGTQFSASDVATDPGNYVAELIERYGEADQAVVATCRFNAGHTEPTW